MSEIIRLSGMTFSVDRDDEPRIRDVDLAKNLGYSRPRDIKKLIERERSAGIFNDSDVCATVAQTSPLGGRPSTDYWLNEFAALYIAASAETPKAREFRAALVRMFMEVRQRAAQNSKESRLLHLIAHNPNTYAELWPNDAVADICQCCRINYDGIHFPQAMFPICEEVYRLILPDALYATMRLRNPRPILDDGKLGDRKHKHHQFFEQELRRVMSEQMDIIRLLARQSRTRDEFLARLRRQYRGAMLQTAF